MTKTLLIFTPIISLGPTVSALAQREIDLSDTAVLDQGIRHARAGDLCAEVGEAFQAHGAFLAVFHVERVLGLALEQRDELLGALLSKQHRLGFLQ